MSDVTIKNLSRLLDTPVDKLLAQLTEAGMEFSSADQVISNTERVKLLGFLRRSQPDAKADAEPSTAPRKITLRRRTVSELTVPTGQRGVPAKTVNVEVRQKRTYVKRSDVEASAAAESEREEALRKLEESRALQEREQADREAADKRRKDEASALEREKEEQAQREQEERAAAEATQVAAAKAAEPEPEPEPVPVPVPVPETRPAASAPPAPPPAPPRKPAPTERARRDAPARPRGGRGAPAGRGQLHLSSEGAARRSGRKRPARRQAGGGSASAQGPHGFSRPSAPVVRDVEVGETVVVSELAQRMAVKGGEIVKALFQMGVMATINESIDHDTAVLVIEELGHRAVSAQPADAEVKLRAHFEGEGEGDPRPPVVTIMGHVDHGKTSLLDHIRSTRIASGEAGGITQHIGAYHVETDKGVVTFLDTPGHAAFSSMRARGAQSTDIVVLVVASDDGVKPQTIEAIQHARAAKVPLVVAITKMDKDGADVDNVKQGLSQHEVLSEDWGGDVQFVPVSSRTGEGIDDLLEAILVQAEVLELRAVADGAAAGVVVESSLDRGRGPVATVLILRGTLAKGDFLVCGTEYGRVRAMFDETGVQIESAGPSIPVQVLGLSGVPESGDDFVVVDDERLAKQVAEERHEKRRETRLGDHATRLEDIMAQMGRTEEQIVLNLVIKADVQGSAEALRQSLTEISTDQIKIDVIVSGVGGITESDATLAASSGAVMIGFNVRADASARRVIESQGLELHYFSIIYDVIDQVRQVATGMLGTEVREDIIGTAEVRDVFRSSRYGAVAGCMVVEGVVKRNKPIRVLRDNVVIFQGELESLRRFKENVEEVRQGVECGIGVKQYNDIKPGDQVECFERTEVARVL